MRIQPIVWTVATVAAACAGPRLITRFPAGTADLAEAGMAILADTPALAEFNTAAAVPPAGAAAARTIAPHMRAHRGRLEEGKVIARIMVSEDNDSLGLRKDVSNWWVLQKRGKEWKSLIVAASGSIKELPLATQRHTRERTRVAAGWLPASDGAWVTCHSRTTCCLGGTCFVED